ncbi:IS1380 family transposase [Polaribacter litorisediminis]|uniref:IS1380 family transposase n=1 Tax=Polaribacter litorisediminis TaxID=1908341 RepID=UPI001CC1B531|nr:IS1380 family transposase [Polaribacter litorisediminis]UAM98925.1 IS1380 family transposase [Polaribacter litorisediminis]
MKVIKSNKTITPFAGISFVNESFKTSGIANLIDSTLGKRVKTVGYQYSDIFKSLTSVFMSGGDVIEDLNTSFGKHLKDIPHNNVPSPTTVIRGITKLTVANTKFTSKNGVTYNFNINTQMNRLNLKSLLLTQQLKAGKSYDFDYDNQIIKNSNYDAKTTYKKCKGYLPGVATIGDKIVYIENRDGNANVKFEQAQTLERAYQLLESESIKIHRSRMDAGSYSKEIIDIVDKNSQLFYIRANKSTTVFEQIMEVENWQEIELNYKKYEVASIPFKQFHQERNYRLVIMREKSNSTQIDLFTKDHMKYRTILTNDWDSSEKEVIEYYNQRGKVEKVFDVMNNDFGWKRLPFSFLDQNGTFMIITAMIKNFYTYFINIVSEKFEDLKPTSRLKRFVFKFIAVAGQWIYEARQYKLRLFSDKPYFDLKI